MGGIEIAFEDERVGPEVDVLDIEMQSCALVYWSSGVWCPTTEKKGILLGIIHD